MQNIETAVGEDNPLPRSFELLNPMDQSISFQDFLQGALFGDRLRRALAPFVLRLAAERIIARWSEQSVEAASCGIGHAILAKCPVFRRLPAKIPCHDRTSFFWQPAERYGRFSIR